MLKLVNATIEVPGRTLLADAELELERGEHVVLVGPNGSRQDDPDRDPRRAREPAAGSVRTGHNVKVGYLSQHAETAAGTGTVLDAAQRETGLSGQKARDLLGGFLFSGADVEKSLDDISGGEQRRLSLAILVASGANVLILDEPTNHLDIESREALEDALSAFEGAVILVSHDRALLEAVGSRTLVCEGGELRSYPSGWAEYQRRREEDAEAASAAAAGEQSARPKGGKRQSPRTIAQRAARKAGRLAAEDRARRGGAARGRGGAGRSRRLVDARQVGAERNERHDAGQAKVAELYEQWEEGRSRTGQRSGRSSLTTRALAGRQGDVADPDLLRLGVGSAEVGALDELAQDRPHLVFGEGGADAAAHAAAEGDPGVVVGLALEEALGPELLRLGEEVLAVVQGGDRRHHEACPPGSS